MDEGSTAMAAKQTIHSPSGKTKINVYCFATMNNY